MSTYKPENLSLSIEKVIELIINSNILDVNDLKNYKTLNKNTNILIYKFLKYKCKKFIIRSINLYKNFTFNNIIDCTQKIYEIIPTIWIFNTAFNNDNDRIEVRSKVGYLIEKKFSKEIEEDHYVPPGPPNFNNSTKETTEEYIRIQYIYNPKKTIINYINEINNKLSIKLYSIDELNNLIQKKTLTLPLLLQKLYTIQDLSYYGY